MKEPDLDSLKALLAALPGTGLVSAEGIGDWRLYYRVKGRGDQTLAGVKTLTVLSGEYGRQIADLVVAARTALPELIRMLEERDGLIHDLMIDHSAATAAERTRVLDVVVASLHGKGRRGLAASIRSKVKVTLGEPGNLLPPDRVRQENADLRADNERLKTENKELRAERQRSAERQRNHEPGQHF